MSTRVWARMLRPASARLGLTLMVTMTGTVQAQTPAPAPTPDVSRAAEVITAAELARHVGVLAHDSMQRHGRAPQGRGVELMAQYVAAQLGQLGLQPGGTPAGITAATWIQRYPSAGWKEVRYPGSAIAFIRRLSHQNQAIVAESGDPVSKDAVANFGADAYPLMPAAEMKPFGFVAFEVPPGSVLLTGPHMAAVAQHASVRGVDVLYVPPRHTDSATQAAVVRALYEGNPGRGVIVVSTDDDSAAFAARRAVAQRQPFRLVEEYMRGASTTRHGWAVAVRGAAIAPWLRAVAGVDLAAPRAADTPQVRPLSGATVVLSATAEADTTRTAPNVVGILEGRDPVLKSQYLLVTAHLDSLTPNAAVDNASGVAGLLAVAKALSEPGARPRRSVVFLATSGAAQDFVGSNFFCGRYLATVPCRKVEAVINLDMIGNGTGDTLIVDGASELELAAAPAWVLASHPELALHLTGGAIAYAPESDYFAFARRGVPSLHFHTGRHAEVRAGAGPRSGFDPAYATRVTQLAFYVTHGLAEAEPRPRWTAEGRQRRTRFLESES